MFENKPKAESASKDSDDCRVISDPQFESSRIEGEGAEVPVLMCMTFADRLLAEMLDDSGEYNKARAKKDIAKHFEVSYKPNVITSIIIVVGIIIIMHVGAVITLLPIVTLGRVYELYRLDIQIRNLAATLLIMLI